MEDAEHALALDDVTAASQVAWDLGRDLCTDCGGYHRVWGMLRAAGVVGGTAVDAPLLEPLIASLSAPGSRILLAGSADAGLLALTLRAAPGPVCVTVADLCPTPLALLERMALPAGVDLTTLLTDVGTLDGSQVWDLVLSHSMLPFVPEPGRAEVVRALKRSLAPNGRAIVVIRASRRMDDHDQAAHDASWLDRARQRIQASGAPLPGPEGEVDALLTDFAALRRSQLAGFETPQDIADVLESGGLRVVQTLSSAPSTRVSLNSGDHVRQSYVFVCE